MGSRRLTPYERDAPVVKAWTPRLDLFAHTGAVGGRPAGPASEAATAQATWAMAEPRLIRTAPTVSWGTDGVQLPIDSFRVREAIELTGRIRGGGAAEVRPRPAT